VLNAPLGETLAARLAASYERPAYPLKAEPSGDSYAVDPLEGGLLLRGSLRWTPNESLTVDLIASNVHNPSHAGQWRYFGDYPTYPAGQSPLFDDSTSDYTGATPNPGSALRISQDRSEHVRHNKGWSAQLRVELELGTVVVRSLSHYLDARFSTDFDRDSSDLDIERATFDAWTEVLSQEIALASNTDGRLQWLVGGMWQSERPVRWKYLEWNYQRNAAAGDFVVFNRFTFAPYDACGPAGGQPCLFTGLPADYIWLDVDVTAHTDTAGAFAHASLDVSDRLRLSGGVRYNRVERNVRDATLANIFRESLDQVDDNFCLGVIGVALPAGVCFDLLFTQPTGGLLTPANTAFWIPIRGDRIVFTGNTQPIRLHRAWPSVTGEARVEYEPREDVLLYALFGSGSRAGGFNVIEGWEGHRGYGPERNFAYEVGANTASSSASTAGSRRGSTSPGATRSTSACSRSRWTARELSRALTSHCAGTKVKRAPGSSST
jgi:outer membrane receptor protein involved in Fe transport